MPRPSAGDTAETQAKTASGQTKAQAKRVKDTATTEAKKLRSAASDAADDASKTTTAAAQDVTDRVEGTSPDRGYETWTRAELYERAQELDIQGRAGMKKRDLIEALRNH